MQGVNAEVSKFFAKSVQNYIISSRAIQGQHEMHEATPGERDDVVQRWNNVKFDLKNFYQWKRKEKVAGKRPEEPRLDSSEAGFERPRTGWRQTKNMSFEERKKLHADKDAWKRGFLDAPVPQSNASDASRIQTSSSEDPELEKAIQASVRETSRGNSEEDAHVEAAIRESIKAVRQQVGSNEAGPLPLKDPSIFEDADYQITDEEYQALVERAIQQSLGDDVPLPDYSDVPELDATDTVSQPPAQTSTHEDDEELKRAIEASRNQPPPALPPREENDDELERAIAASKEAMEQESNQRSEEDIVMEYVKRQSLAEEEYRKQMAKGKGAAGGGDDDDEELKRAMEESLKMNRGDASGPSER
jgi:hypothetical protein